MAFVYLLGDSGRENTYKIGVTRGKIEKRIKQLQTGNSNEIYLINSFETEYPFYLERILHTKYHIKQTKNEWFVLTNEDIEEFIPYCQLIEENAKNLKKNPFTIKHLK